MALKWIKAITGWLCQFPRLRREYIEVGGLKWALQNAGTDAENPNGKLYAWDEAMELEDKTWRVPSKSQWRKFIKRTLFSLDKKREVGIFEDRKTGARIKFPAVGWRYGGSSGTLYYAGECGCYWLPVTYTTRNAYYLYFSSSNLLVARCDKQNGFSVRLVCRCPSIFYWQSNPVKARLCPERYRRGSKNNR